MTQIDTSTATVDRLENSLIDLGDVDVKIEVEQVFGGWVGYVWIMPESGAMVRTDRDRLYAHTGARATRAEAISAIPEVIEYLVKEKDAAK